MTAVFEPPLTRSGVWAGLRRLTPLTEGPLLLRTRGMSRWHRPRSGGVYSDPGHTAFTLWCGQSVTSGGRPGGFITSDALPGDGVPLCGPCEGRAVGAGHPGVAVAVRAGTKLLFDPERLAPPRACPGGGRYGIYDVLDDPRAGRCLVCGSVQPIRGYSDAGGGWAVLQRHEPGPGLVDGCPFHAWRHLVRHGETVRCECQVPRP